MQATTHIVGPPTIQRISDEEAMKLARRGEVIKATGRALDAGLDELAKTPVRRGKPGSEDLLRVLFRAVGGFFGSK